MNTTIIKKYTLSATGILDIQNGVVSIEDANTGEMVDLNDLLIDFADKTVTLNVVYEDYK